RDVSCSPCKSAPRRWLEQLDRISVRIFDLNLLAAWSCLHPIAKLQSRRFQLVDPGRKVVHAQDHAVPPARLLGPAIRHWPGPGRLRAAEQQVERTERHRREGGHLLVPHLESKVFRIELDGSFYVLGLIPDAVKSRRRLRA